MYHKFTILSGLLGIWKERRILQFLHMLSTYRNHKHFINNSGWTGALEVDEERLRKTVSECSGGRKGSKKHLKSLSNGLLFSQSFRAHPKIKMMPSSMMPNKNDAINFMSLQTVFLPWNTKEDTLRNVSCNETLFFKQWTSMVTEILANILQNISSFMFYRKNHSEDG